MLLGTGNLSVFRGFWASRFCVVLLVSFGDFGVFAVSCFCRLVEVEWFRFLMVDLNLVWFGWFLGFPLL